MAKKKASKSESATIKDTIETLEADATPIDSVDMSEGEISKDVSLNDTETPPEPEDEITQDILENAAPEGEAQEDMPSEADRDTSQTDSMTSRPAETESSFLPMIMGGAAAGAIGFAAAYFGLANQPLDGIEMLDTRLSQVETSIGTQTTELGALIGQVEGLSTPDLTPVETQLDDFSSGIKDLGHRLDTAISTMNTLDTRLTGLEKAPVTDGASEAAIAAYEKELKAASEDIAQQRADLEKLVSEAIGTKGAAEEAALAAEKRAGLSRVLSALDSGTPFDGAVADLQTAGVDVPDALAQVAGTGVGSAADLQESFPEVARAALAKARQTTTQDGDTDGGLSGFLRTQLGARSLEPREGNDPDAVLSRAEAAIREGRLTDALSEIDVLPDEAKAELADWAIQATARLDAVRAAQSLSEALN